MNELEGELADTASDLNALWFKAGLGGDISFTDHLFLRFGLLYGIRTKTKLEDDLVPLYKLYRVDDAQAILGHGPDFKVAIGYKF